MTVSELLTPCGSSNHDANDKTLVDLYDALGEAHPVVAGDLVEQTRRALDKSIGEEFGTASGSEHPNCHDALERTQDQSKDKGCDT